MSRVDIWDSGYMGMKSRTKADKGLRVVNTEVFKGTGWAHQQRPRSRAHLGTFEKSGKRVLDLVCL